MGSIILSILTPAVPKRMLQIAELCEKLADQIGDLPVEHLVLIDNKRRSVGEKRDNLLRLSRGKYVAYVDDDDDIAPGYVASLLKAAVSDPDVITFRQSVEYNEHRGEVEFRLGHPNELFEPDKVTKRNAWHTCAWRRSLAVQSQFPKGNYGEDWEFAKMLCSIEDLREVHIPEILHHYRHNAATTEAPP